MLSVQVHPSDRQTDLLPAGESGKTEAWVVLEAGPESRIYAGLKPGTTPDDLRRALANRTLADHLAAFTPRPGDAVFIRAGTVHTLGGGVVVFEVQENSDVTFRLYDWDRVDARTGQPRALQVDQAMACIDFAQTAVGPVTPVMEATTPVLRERLFHSEQFSLWRLRGNAVLSRRGGHAARAGVHRGQGAVGVGWYPLPRRPRRRRPLAGGGRRVFLPAARCRLLVGSCPAGIVLAGQHRGRGVRK